MKPKNKDLVEQTYEAMDALVEGLAKPVDRLNVLGRLLAVTLGAGIAPDHRANLLLELSDRIRNTCEEVDREMERENALSNLRFATAH